MKLTSTQTNALATPVLLGCYLFAAAPAAVAAGVDGLHQFWIDKTHENSSKIRNYQATIRQTDNHSAEPLIADIQFQAPLSFSMTVQQPKAMEGMHWHYHNNSLRLFNPQAKQSLYIDGLRQPDPNQALQRVKDIYWFNHELYQRTFTPSIEVAERISVGVDLEAKEADNVIRKSELFIDYDYSLLMQGAFYYDDGTTMSMTHEAIAFNQNDFQLQSPSASMNADASQYWNLNEAPVQRKQAEAHLSRQPRWPELSSSPWSLNDPRYFVSNPGQAAAYQYNDNYFLLSLLDTSGSDHRGDGEPGTALQLNKELEGRLVQTPAMSSLVFYYDGIEYRLLSNVHPETLIRLARELVAG